MSVVIPATAQFPPFDIEPGVAPVIEEEETTGHQEFPLVEVERPPRIVCPHPGYGPGERILFPPTRGFRDVWAMFYLNKDKEFSFTFPMSDGIWATGDWFRLRHKLLDHGVNIIASYTADFQGNVTGGESRGFAYADNYDLAVDFDLQKLVGWPEAHLVLSCVDRNGSNLSQQHIGNQFTVAQVWETETISYYSLCFSQNLFDGWWNIKIGRLATMDDFGSSPIYSLYLNGGINTQPQAFPVSGYLTVYPASTWGSRIRFNDKKHNLYAMFGIYQTTNRLFNPAYHGLDFSIRSNDGINFVWEIGWTPEWHTYPPSRYKKKSPIPIQGWYGLPGNYKFGIYYTPWRDIYQFYPHKNTFYTYGFYWLFDQMIYQAIPGTDLGLTLWTAFVYSPQQNTALLPFEGIAGAIYTGLIPRRSRDQTIFAVIYGAFSKNYASTQQTQRQGYPTYELVLEASYRMNLSSFFYIQPDIQYIIRPGGTGSIPNALVIGAQIGCNF